MGRKVVSRNRVDRLRQQLEEQGKRNILCLPGPADGRVELRWEDSQAELKRERERSLMLRGFLTLGFVSAVLVLLLLIVLAAVA